MARLLSLSMKGFKSFGRQTTINFEKGLNGIVGANGSGKSNIMDAIFFVIGSSRISAMRAKRGGELIFNSKTVKPEYAEVRLAVDNSSREFGEDWGDVMTISRRVRADGMSAYRINGRRMTRFQIVDILARARIFPDGHNIIQQGELIALVKKNADERRQMIEELAGIKEYDEKKHKAFLELGVVEQKVNEINSILRERQRNLERLKKEREQAERYEKLREVKVLFEDSIVKRKLEEKEEEKRKLSTEREAEEKSLASVEAELAGYSERIDSLRKEIASLDKELSKMQSGENLEIAKEAERLSSTLSGKRGRLTQIAEQTTSGAKRRDAIISREIPDLSEQAKKRLARIESAQRELGEVERAISELEKKRLEFLSIFSRESEIEKEFEARKKEAQKALDELATLERSATFELEKASSIARRSEEDRESFEKALSDLKKKMSQGLSKAKSLEDNERVLLEKERSLSIELSEKRADLESLEAGISEGISRVSFISGKLGELSSGGTFQNASALESVPGYLGRLSQFVGKSRVPEILGASLLQNSIVVDSRESAIACAKVIRERSLGRTTILIAGGKGALPGKASSPPLSELLTFSGGPVGLESAIFSSLDGFSVEKDLETALALGKDAVTEEGDIVSGNGLIIETGKIVLRERLEEDLERERLLLEKEKGRKILLAEELQAVSQSISELSKQIRALSIELASSVPSKADLAEEKRLSERILASEDLRDKALLEKERISKELSGISVRRADAEGALAQIAPKEPLSSAEKKINFSEIKALEEKASSLRKSQSTLAIEISEAGMRVKNYIEPEIESLSRLVRSLEKEEEKLKNEGISIEAEISSLENQVKEAEGKVASKMALLKETSSKKSELAKSLEKEERKRYEFLAKKTAIDGKIALLSMKLDGISAEISALSLQIEGKAKFIPGTIKKLTSQLATITDRISRLGAINQRALLEFEEAEVEFKDVEVKKVKLEEEKQSIVSFMETVERRKKDTFLEHYNSISANFSRIYSKLSGGEGELALENPETIFDGGLIIKAKPLGKEVSRIDLLSGGEQSMAALAFIFSIQEHTPAPFYILDEVDAALDKTNSEKLGVLIKGYSENSQIVIITHKDAVMRFCDQLVGVYLSPEKISKIISQPTEDFLRKATSKQVDRGDVDGGGVSFAKPGQKESMSEEEEEPASEEEFSSEE